MLDLGEVAYRSAAAWMTIALVVAFALGAATVKGCDHLRHSYTLKLEKR